MEKPSLILDFEKRKPGAMHPAPWHNTMLVLLKNRPLKRNEIERRYKRTDALPLIQPDNIESITEILNNLIADAFVAIDEMGRYFFQSNLPYDGFCHSTIQYDYGGLIPVREYKKPVSHERQKIIDYIEFKKEVGKRDVMRKFRYATAYYLKKMEEEGVVKINIVKLKGRPKKIYSMPE